jgi:hypothetical protein
MTMMTHNHSLLGPFGLSIAALTLSAGFIAFSGAPVLTACMSASIRAADLSASKGSLISRHNNLTRQWQTRIGGRSLFFPPQPKSHPAIVVQQQIQPETKPPVIFDPGYTGPSLIALVGNSAWFKPARVGESTLMLWQGQERLDLALVSTDSPWTARVRYHGREYTLTLFDSHKSDPYLASAALPDVLQPWLHDVEATDAEESDTDAFGGFRQ